MPTWKGIRMKRRISGFTLVECLVVIAIISTLLAMIWPAIMRVRGSAERLQCSTRLNQIGLALHHYHLDYGVFPAGCSYENGNSPQPFMNWHVRILPYLEDSNLYTQAINAFLVNKDFLKVPPHYGLVTKVQKFLCPSEDRDSKDIGDHQPAFTSYLGVEGTNQTTKDGILYLDSKVKMGGITDGLTNTIMVGERPPSAKGDMGWWYAGWGQGKEGSTDSVLGTREYNYYAQTQNCPLGPYHFVRGSVQQPM